MSQRSSCFAVTRLPRRFGRASDAGRAATESQHALTKATWPGHELKVRMGLQHDTARISTTVDRTLLDDARRLHAGTTDAELIDEALTIKPDVRLAHFNLALIAMGAY